MTINPVLKSRLYSFALYPHEYDKVKQAVAGVKAQRTKATPGCAHCIPGRQCTECMVNKLRQAEADKDALNDRLGQQAKVLNDKLEAQKKALNYRLEYPDL
jgi:peptide subunit release factor 1 (eRF1)